MSGSAEDSAPVETPPPGSPAADPLADPPTGPTQGSADRAAPTSFADKPGLRLLLLGLLPFVVIWLRPGPWILYGVDAGIYARVAAELARAPLSTWGTPTLDGVPFFDHPPLALWLEGLFLRLNGAAPTSLVLLARLYATAVVAVALLIAGRFGAAPLTLVGAALVALPGFAFESQNPMLELPFTVALGLGLLGIVAEGRRPQLVLVALGFAAAALIKGPPALALVPVVLYAAWESPSASRRALLAGLSLGILVVLVVFWALGSEYRDGYLAGQVGGSLRGERDVHALRAPWFYAGVLLRWYAPLVLFTPLAFIAWRRLPQGHAQRRLIALSGLTIFVLVAGFSAVAKKNTWYIHPVMLPGALLLAALGATLLPAWGLRLLSRLGAFALVLWMAVALVAPERLSAGGTELRAIHTLVPPTFAAGAPRKVAHCGKTGEWKARHLFALLWHAELVPCAAPASWQFDGTALAPRP